MSNEDLERRAKQAALAGAIIRVKKEFPNHRVDAQTSFDSANYKAVIKISHPAAMDGCVIIGVEV